MCYLQSVSSPPQELHSRFPLLPSYDLHEVEAVAYQAMGQVNRKTGFKIPEQLQSSSRLSAYPYRHLD